MNVCVALRSIAYAPNDIGGRFQTLESEGLPQNLQASVSQLFEAIQQGHTALQLSNEDADLWTKTLVESEIATLFAVNHGALQIRRHFAQELRLLAHLKTVQAILRSLSISTQDN